MITQKVTQNKGHFDPVQFWRDEADVQRELALMLWGKIKEIKKDYGLNLDINLIESECFMILDGSKGVANHE